jgi:signal transduction histidine kinase
MTLVVRRDGSTSAAFSRFRWRNQIVSSIVLAALVAALGVFVASAERAHRLGRMQTVVSASLSHELRTPLASLRIAADDLMSGQAEGHEQVRQYGDIVDAQSRRIGHVVDQALAFASATNPHNSAQLRPVSVADVVRAAVEALAPALLKAGIVVEQQVTPDLPRVLADPELVLRCLTNLIENASKYAASGGWVALSAQVGRRSRRSVVEVTVEDRGPGIADRERTAVFEPFYRGTSARQSRQPGSGLGLAIVKSAIEAQGGWVRLERAAPHGCKIRLFFLAEEQVAEAVRPV